MCRDLRVWDAKMPMHLALPRSVGPYMVIRTTRRLNDASRVNIFGTFKFPYAADGAWSNVMRLAGVVNGNPMNGLLNTVSRVFDVTALGGSLTACPSATSLQIMNGEALQTTSGVVYAGVLNTQLKLAADARTWDALAETFVEYQNPRLLTAGKLALRGVQINSMPLNMTDISQFAPLSQTLDSTFTYGAGDVEPAGWAPIMVYNPNAIALEYLYTTEWRVRFDVANPASASHRHYPVAADTIWDRLVRQGMALGNGVIDITDVVANLGGAARRVNQALGGVRSLPLLVD